MNEKIELLGIVLLAFTFAIGAFYMMPKVNAQDVLLFDGNGSNGNTVSNDHPYGNDDLINCPAVCVPMWIIQGNDCKFIECGSGCGVNNKNSFETEEECIIYIKEKPINNHPILQNQKIRLLVKFTPVENQVSEMIKESMKVSDDSVEIDNELDAVKFEIPTVTIYDISKIHISIVSNIPLNNDGYNLSLNMIEMPLGNSESELHNLYLKLDNVVGVSAGYTNQERESIQNKSNNFVSNSVDISEDNVEVYTSINSNAVNSNKPTTENGAVINSTSQGSVTVSDDVDADEYRRKLYRYNYTISLKNNLNKIKYVFGKNYNEKSYNLEINLVKNGSSRVIVNDETAPLKPDVLPEVLSSRKFILNFGSLNEIPNSFNDSMQERVRISNNSVAASISNEINNIRKNSVSVKSFTDSEIVIDDSTDEMYVVTENKVKKVISVKEILSSNNINSESVIGNVDLVSVDDNPEYAFKIKERRKILWIIPFGYREKYISLDATEQVQIDSEN
jgi:hypothetical protein